MVKNMKESRDAHRCKKNVDSGIFIHHESNLRGVREVHGVHYSR